CAVPRVRQRPRLHRASGAASAGVRGDGAGAGAARSADLGGAVGRRLNDQRDRRTHARHYVFLARLLRAAGGWRAAGGGGRHARGRAPVRRECRLCLAHDPEKWIPVFGKDHAPTMSSAMPIIVNLDIMLARRKMRSKELAEQIGITEQNVSLLKSGKVRGVRFETLERICAALDCQPGDILEYRVDAGTDDLAAGRKRA